MKSPTPSVIKIGVLASLAVVFIGLSSCAVDKDKNQRDAFVGTWQTDTPEGKVIWTLSSDGTYAGVSGNDKFSGTWEVKDGYLVTKLNSGPQSPGGTFSDKILESSNSHFIIRSTEMGRTERHERIK
jgi:hypothetical protein